MKEPVLKRRVRIMEPKKASISYHQKFPRLKTINYLYNQEDAAWESDTSLILPSILDLYFVFHLNKVSQLDRTEDLLLMTLITDLQSVIMKDHVEDLRVRITA